jgi:hypothetical protein
MTPQRDASCRPTLLALLALLALPALTGSARAQVPEGDPRDVEDPRLVTDPRAGGDPREVVADPLEGEPGPKLYDSLYDSGQEARLAGLFRENAWDLLDYIDGHCEAWLGMVERGDAETEAGRARIAEVQARGRKLARVADTAIGTSRFSRYVETFYAWDDEEQRLLREGQALYRQGIQLIRSATSAQAAQAAMTPLHQALSRARRIDDAWGQAMALAAIGNLQADAGMLNEARATLANAVRIGREIRALDSVWEALSRRYEIAMWTQDYDQAEEVLKEQHVIAQDVGDDEVEDRVWQQLVNLDVYRRAARGG